LTASVISIQAALLYTNSKGERRIRVHNMAMPVQSILSKIFESVRVDALTNVLGKQALEVSIKMGLDSARARLQQACVEIVRSTQAGGRQFPQQQQQAMQLPEAIQLVPLYTMALQKNICFRGGTELRPDERAFYMALLANMPVSHSRQFIYPQLFSLHDMPADAGLPVGKQPNGKPAEEGSGGDGNTTSIKLPPVLNLSAERLSSEGLFMLEDSVQLCIWVGRQCNPQLVQSLFGTPQLDNLDLSSLLSTAYACSSLCLRAPPLVVLPRVDAIIQSLRSTRNTHLRIMVVGEADGQNEHRFFWHLVEDRATFPGGSMSYSEFMQNVHRQSFGGI
ncbi:unnamed protein product, partial [Chrysoparadoxa australica]